MEKIRYYTVRFFFFIGLMIFGTVTTHAQTSEIGDFLRAGQADAETLTKAYLNPIPNGIGADLNTGWFTGAEPHSTLGFDIQIRGALAFVPSGGQSFDINDLNLEKTSLASGESSITPTAAGDDSPGPEVVVREDGEEITRFNLPQGSGFDFVPAPMIQASVGIIKKTDITVRFVPNVEIEDLGDFNLKGIGIKHSLSQWLVGGNLPVDISIFAGFSRVNLNANLDLDPAQGSLPDPDNPNANYDNQEVETAFNSFSSRLIVGKDLPFISVYGAVGYETSSMDLDVTGNYPIEVPSAVPGQTQTETLTDPFSYSEDGDNTYSLSGGVKFKLGFFHLFGEYTLADYSVANGGIAFSFR
jgi:hypothetical protein